MIQKSEEEFLDNYEINELSVMKKEYTNFFKKRQQNIITQIEDKYGKPVKEMYSSTQSVIRNMVRYEMDSNLESFSSRKDHFHHCLAHRIRL